MNPTNLTDGGLMIHAREFLREQMKKILKGIGLTMFIVPIIFVFSSFLIMFIKSDASVFTKLLPVSIIIGMALVIIADSQA